MCERVAHGQAVVFGHICPVLFDCDNLDVALDTEGVYNRQKFLQGVEMRQE